MKRFGKKIMTAVLTAALAVTLVVPAFACGGGTVCPPAQSEVTESGYTASELATLSEVEAMAEAFAAATGLTGDNNPFVAVANMVKGYIQQTVLERVVTSQGATSLGSFSTLTGSADQAGFKMSGDGAFAGSVKINPALVPAGKTLGVAVTAPDGSIMILPAIFDAATGTVVFPAYAGFTSYALFMY